jgi:hypothetical protein
MCVMNAIQCAGGSICGRINGLWEIYVDKDEIKHKIK